MATAKTIFIKGNGVRKEALAIGACKPGHLLVLNNASKVLVHATSGGPAAKLFAVEDDLQGNDIDEEYAIGVLVQYNIAQRGDEVWGFLKDGENIAIGDYLQSGGNGELIKYVAGSALVVEYPESIIGTSLVALDMSGSSAVDPASQRIRLEVI